MVLPYGDFTLVIRMIVLLCTRLILMYTRIDMKCCVGHSLCYGNSMRSVSRGNLNDRGAMNKCIFNLKRCLNHSLYDGLTRRCKHLGNLNDKGSIRTIRLRWFTRLTACCCLGRSLYHGSAIRRVSRFDLNDWGEYCILPCYTCITIRCCLRDPL